MTPSAVVVGLIAEDVRLHDFVSAACRKLGRELSGGVRIGEVAKTQGCRRRVLHELARRMAPQCDLLVLATDVSGRGHELRKQSARRKTRALLDVVGPVPTRIVCAVADPCVEAWLLSDPAALGAGLEAVTGRACRPVPDWPRPRSEAQAKDVLARVIGQLLGSLLPRFGFEYADGIVEQLDLERSPSPSLAQFAREFASALRELQGS